MPDPTYLSIVIKVLKEEGLTSATLDKYVNFFRYSHSFESKAFSQYNIKNGYKRVFLTPFNPDQIMRESQTFRNLTEDDARRLLEAINDPVAEAEAFRTGEVSDATILSILTRCCLQDVIKTEIVDVESLAVNRRRALWINNGHVVGIRKVNEARKKSELDAVNAEREKKAKDRASKLINQSQNNLEGFPPLNTRCSNAGCMKLFNMISSSSQVTWTRCPICHICWFCPKSTCGNQGNGTLIKQHRKICLVGNDQDSNL